LYGKIGVRKESDMKVLRYALLAVLVLGAIAAALYVGVWLMLIGGIVQVVEAVKTTPVPAMEIAVGAVRVLGAAFVGVLTFWAGVGLVALVHKLTEGGKTGGRTRSKTGGFRL
jgi:uncharacterized metal-binding protein